jgi:putative CocE/NonD family hydrolase
VRAPLAKLLWLALLLSASWAASRAYAQDLEFRAPASAADPNVPAVMRDLAVRVLPVYQEKDPEKYLSNLFALQMVAGDPTSAFATRQSLIERRRNPSTVRATDRAVLYDIYARARGLEASDRIPFQQAFAQAYRETVPRLNDRDAYTVTRWFGAPLSALQGDLQRSLDTWRSKGNIPLQQAVDLIWTYLSFVAYRSFSPLVGPLDTEDDRRRYETIDNVVIRTADGASIAAVVVRPRTAAKPLPALFEFSIYEAPNYALEAASHGYVSVTGYARGVGASSGNVVPFQTDGDDARVVINWIVKQPWSDGRVGMFGVAYSGFTAWAAAKKLPAALKAIATTDPTAPGIDGPMAGSIFRNSSYRWLYQVTRDDEGPEEKTFADDGAWRAFNQAWYSSGRRYREFPSLPGRYSNVFRGWLNHPSYDRYWQKMVPAGEQFAHIDIPVLTTTGYYADGGLGAIHYFSEHVRHSPKANHTLVVGPYDDGVIQRSPAGVLRGYQVDSAALIELRDLRYQWFDYALKGAKRPAMLKDRVNYQLMGSNEWRSASSIETMGQGAMRLYLEENLTGDVNRLLAAKPTEAHFLPQTFDLADRGDAAWTPPTEIVTRAFKPHNGEVFVSEPLPQATDVSGLLSGRLEFTVNKVDMDLYLTVYEVLANGEYVRLSEPYEFRASYAQDRSKRRLFSAGVRQQLPFKSERLTGRRMAAGSRVALVLGVNKRPDRQINYGTGDDVSEESLDDATVPLRIRWYNSSYVDVPLAQ